MKANMEMFYNDADGSVSCRSYNVIVARRDKDGLALDPRYYQYSATTKRHVAKFLGESISVVREKVKAGTYRLADLNGNNYHTMYR
jgi:hypothetical protein